MDINNVNHDELIEEMFLSVPIIKETMDMIQAISGVSDINEILRLAHCPKREEDRKYFGVHKMLYLPDGTTNMYYAPDEKDLIKKSEKYYGIIFIPGTRAHLLYDQNDVIEYCGEKYLAGPMWFYRNADTDEKDSFLEDELREVLITLQKCQTKVPFREGKLPALKIPEGGTE